MTRQELEILFELQIAVKAELGEQHTLSSMLNSWHNPESNITNEDMMLMLKEYNADREKVG